MKIAHLVAVTLLGFAGASPALAQGLGDLGFGVHIGSGGVDVRVGAKHRDRHPRHSDAPRSVWVPGHWEWCDERVQEPGRWDQVWIEPVYEWRIDHCGRRERVCVRPGYYERRWCEGRWVTRQVQKWVPGYWTTSGPSCPPGYPDDRWDGRYPSITHGDVSYRR